MDINSALNNHKTTFGETTKKKALVFVLGVMFVAGIVSTTQAAKNGKIN